MTNRKALVLFSGGQDSTTCLAWALSRYERVETIGFDYGQNHVVELDVRRPVRNALRDQFPLWNTRFGRDQLFRIDLRSFSRSALLGDGVEPRADGLPATYVPGRNLIFLTYAAIVAEQRGIGTLIGGMCETDYSGYPDCRDDAIRAMQSAISLGMQSSVVIETPLMWLDKAATWKLAAELGGHKLVELIIEKTHTCYRGNRRDRHEWGVGCAECDACRLRARGWETVQAQLRAKADMA